MTTNTTTDDSLIFYENWSTTLRLFQQLYLQQSFDDAERDDAERHEFIKNQKKEIIQRLLYTHNIRILNPNTFLTDKIQWVTTGKQLVLLIKSNYIYPNLQHLFEDVFIRFLGYVCL